MAVKGFKPGDTSWQERANRRSKEEKQNIDKAKQRQKRKEERRNLIQQRIIEFARKNPTLAGDVYDRTQQAMREILKLDETEKEEGLKNDIRNQIRMAKAITKGANAGRMAIVKGSTIWQDQQAEMKKGKIAPSRAKQEQSTEYDSQTNDSEKKEINEQVQLADKIDREYFPPIEGKPKILLITDVKDWAWWNKSQYIKKYLSDEFEFDIISVIGKGRQSVNKSKYDLYMTFGYSYVGHVNGIPPHKKITGVTAHRPRALIIGQMKKCKWVHANSLMLLKELKGWGINDAFYIPNGVDEELFRPVIPIPEKRGNIVVGHIGKRNALKGQDQYIIPAIIKANAERYVNVKNYTSKNVIPFHEMYKEYQNIDVFIVSSTEDGTPNPALEAAACGRPIISNEIGNMPEFIKNGYNGFIVERNVDAYVEKINWFRENRSELIRMGENARQTVLDGWTWEKQAINYKNMFRVICGKN